EQPSEELQILNTSTYTDSSGYFHVLGEVKNNLTSNIENVKLVVTFYDSENLVIGADHAYADIDILEPNQKSPFELSSSPYVISPASYEIAVEFRFTSEQPSEGLTVLSYTASVDSLGNHRIVGEVKNDGTSVTTSVKVVCTYYEQGGKVIGESHAYTELDAIAVGDTAPFELNSYRELTPAYFELQVQGSAPSPTSPPPTSNLQILSSSTYINSLGIHIVGELKNNLTSNIEYVKLVVTFYDSENVVIGADYSYADIDILEPNQTSPFELSSYPYVISPASYKISMEYRETTDEPFEGLTILSYTSSVDSSGYPRIVGEVKNYGATQATFVNVVCTFYDSSGTVIGKADAYTNPSTINAGDTAPFELSLYRQLTPAYFELQVQG
ncbi:MAG: FxLYD domain-containing protein, partial [Candidatus Bathyarchaeia archaeon]|nr:FxLYD domain-containing protein [Candidatus Bathyarchaeia archaeon]